MENLYILKIILKDSPTTNNDINKKLFEFLNNNYKEIINSNYYIQPILINNVNLEYFVKKNIQSTPSLLDEKKDKVLTGLNKIIKYVVKLCECNSDSESDYEEFVDKLIEFIVNKE